MKRLNDHEKRQLGYIIHYYRNQLFKSQINNKNDYKQINFCSKICSQAQLSRLENGDSIKDQEVYERLLQKLGIHCDKLLIKDIIFFEKTFKEILNYQNNDDLIINYQQYILLVNQFQNQFKKNIIYTHYNYALEFILMILNDDFQEADYLLEDVIGTLDILHGDFLVLTLHYLGLYYKHHHDYLLANKYYLSCIEHMKKNDIRNDLVYVDISYNYICMNDLLRAISYLDLVHHRLNRNNFLILERIYRYYSIIYLKNFYYDECNEFLQKAFNLLEPFKKPALKSNLIAIHCISLYFKNEVASCREQLELAKELDYSDKIKILNLIIFKDKDQKIKYENTLYEYVEAFYQIDDRESYFEDELKDYLPKLAPELASLVIHDYYHYLKEHKKYKKALDLAEQFLYYE
jgi:hypothetical protein